MKFFRLSFGAKLVACQGLFNQDKDSGRLSNNCLLFAAGAAEPTENNTQAYFFSNICFRILFPPRKSRMMTFNSHLVAPSWWPNLTGFFIADIVHCSLTLTCAHKFLTFSNHLSWIWNELIGLGETSGVHRQICLCQESCDWLVPNVCWGKKGL